MKVIKIINLIHKVISKITKKKRKNIISIFRKKKFKNKILSFKKLKIKRIMRIKKINKNNKKIKKNCYKKNFVTIQFKMIVNLMFWLLGAQMWSQSNIGAKKIKVLMHKVRKMILLSNKKNLTLRMRII